MDQAVTHSSNSTRIVSRSADNMIQIWDANTGKMIGKPLEGHISAIWSVAFSPDNARIVSGSWESTIRIWDAYTGKSIGEPLEGHTDGVLSVAYSSDGARIVSGSSDHTIRIWDAHAGKMDSEPLEGHTGTVTSAAYPPSDANIVSGLSENASRIANPRNTPSNPCSSWVVNEDGFMLANGSELLMWVPSDVRDTLMRPQNTAIISTQGSVKVDFINARIGDSWAHCYQPA